MIDDIRDGAEIASIISTNMLLESGVTHLSGSNQREQLKNIFMVDEVFGQLEFPVYMKTSLVTSGQANIENSLNLLKMTGYNDVILREYAFMYINENKYSYYAEAPVDLPGSIGNLWFIWGNII